MFVAVHIRRLVGGLYFASRGEIESDAQADHADEGGVIAGASKRQLCNFACLPRNGMAVPSVQPSGTGEWWRDIKAACSFSAHCLPRFQMPEAGSYFRQVDVPESSRKPKKSADLNWLALLFSAHDQQEGRGSDCWSDRRRR